MATYLFSCSFKFVVNTQNYLNYLIVFFYPQIITSFSLNYCISIKSPYLYTDDHRFNEWLAGFIDGDGHFRIDDNKPKLIIELDSQDYSLLLYIQSKIGGNINLAHGNKKAYRYTLYQRSLIIDLVNRINGNIRNSIRVPQFIRLCNFFNIPYQSPVALTAISECLVFRFL
jgi:ubiquinol-cytochrome c reductase cytochrome b subunit